MVRGEGFVVEHHACMRGATHAADGGDFEPTRTGRVRVFEEGVAGRWVGDFVRQLPEPGRRQAAGRPRGTVPGADPEFFSGDDCKQITWEFELETKGAGHAKGNAGEMWKVQPFFPQITG